MAVFNLVFQAFHQLHQVLSFINEFLLAVPLLIQLMSQAVNLFLLCDLHVIGSACYAWWYMCLVGRVRQGDTWRHHASQCVSLSLKCQDLLQLTFDDFLEVVLNFTAFIISKDGVKLRQRRLIFVHRPLKQRVVLHQCFTASDLRKQELVKASCVPGAQHGVRVSLGLVVVVVAVRVISFLDSLRRLINRV